METGRVYGGRYRVIAKLGSGNMGSVWRAEHLALHSEVAVKLMDLAIAQHPEARTRFYREAQAAAALRGPHVVQIFDFGVDHGCPFIVMELLKGESLGSRLTRLGQLSYGDTARIITDVSSALTSAQELGIVHRDLKPDNIFLSAGDPETAKIFDFGVAKGVGHPSLFETHAGTTVGTPCFMSPEQVEGRADLDYRTDIWALGLIAFQCVTGREPFDGLTLSELVNAICKDPLPVPSQSTPVPAGFDAWFARAAARSPQERFPSAAAAARELKAILTESRVTAGKPPRLAGKDLAEAQPCVRDTPLRPSEPSSQDRRHSSRRRAAVKALAAAGAFLLVLGAVLVFTVRNSASRDEARAASVYPQASLSAQATRVPANRDIPPGEEARGADSPRSREVNPSQRLPDQALATSRNQPAALARQHRLPATGGAARSSTQPPRAPSACPCPPAPATKKPATLDDVGL
jgi:serine/threonine protein kinase